MTSTELAVRSDAELALLAQQEQEYDNESLVVPILKLGQPLTAEVVEGEASAGEWINTLTRSSLGTTVDFVVAYYNKGRFASDKDGKAYVAFDTVIPPTWENFVGASFVGTPFSEYPDAEEQYKERVNAKEIEWGKGPKVSTTHNYTGLVIDEEEESVTPIRLSLMRTQVPAHRKINTLIRAAQKAPWDNVLTLSSEKKSWDKGVSYVIQVKHGRKTNAAERGSAVALAEAVINQRANIVGDVDDKPVEPDAKGGLDVG